MFRIGVLVEQTLGPRVLDRVQTYYGGQVESAPRAELMRDVSTLRSYLSGGHLLAIFDSPWVIIFTLLIFLFSWVLGVITLAGMVVLVVLALLDERLTYRAFSASNQSNQEAWQFVAGSARHAELVHALGMRHAMNRLWARIADQSLTHLRQASNRGTLISGATKLVRTGIQVAMLGMGAYLSISENLPAGIMIAATIIVSRAIAPVESFIGGWRGFVEVRNAYARLDSLFTEAAATKPDVDLPGIAGRVEVTGVFYGFSQDSLLIGNASLRIEPGEAVGIVGPSGSGKSTLARLVLGLARPQRGKVLIDGYDVNQYERTVLGPQLGYLPQDVKLFSGSLARNIARMEDPDEHSESIVQVAERVGLAPLLARLPGGFQYPLADNGANLSGGQRQLVGLARALYGSPRLIVLDEPDAGLDQEGEGRLLQVIGEIIAARAATLIVISHNPRIVDRMDRLFMVQDGAVKQLIRKSANADQSVVPILARSAGHE